MGGGFEGAVSVGVREWERRGFGDWGEGEGEVSVMGRERVGFGRRRGRVTRRRISWGEGEGAV